MLHEDLLDTSPPDVLFWTSDRGGSLFSRCQEPARALRLLSVRAEVTPVITESLRRARTIVGHRVVTDRQLEIWRRLAGDRLPGQKLVFDADDDYWSVDETNSPHVHALYRDPGIRANLAEAVGLADLVTVCSARLAEVVREHNPRVRVTPNTLPAELARPGGPVRRPGAPYVLGWAGSPGNHSGLNIVAEPVRRWLDRDRNATLHVIGLPGAAVAAKGLNHPRVRVTEWVSGTADYIRKIDFHVWLASYQDTPFNAAKFPTKVMESSVLGIPVIASDISSYRSTFGPGVTLAGNDDESWYQAIRMVAPLDAWRRHQAAIDGTRHLTECQARTWQGVLTS